MYVRVCDSKVFFFFVLFCCFNHVTAFFPLFFSSIQLEKKPF